MVLKDIWPVYSNLLTVGSAYKNATHKNYVKCTVCTVWMYLFESISRHRPSIALGKLICISKRSNSKDVSEKHNSRVLVVKPIAYTNVKFKSYPMFECLLSNQTITRQSQTSCAWRGQLPVTGCKWLAYYLQHESTACLFCPCHAFLLILNMKFHSCQNHYDKPCVVLMKD